MKNFRNDDGTNDSFGETSVSPEGKRSNAKIPILKYKSQLTSLR